MSNSAPRTPNLAPTPTIPPSPPQTRGSGSPFDSELTRRLNGVRQRLADDFPQLAAAASAAAVRLDHTAEISKHMLRETHLRWSVLMETKFTARNPYKFGPICRILSAIILLFSVLLMVKPTLDPEDRYFQLPSLPELPPRLRESLDSFLSEPVRPGVILAARGLRAHHPLVFVPGIVSTALELWNGEECAQQYFRRRLWGSSNMIRALLADPACYFRHLALDAKTGLDPDGIKVRPAVGLEAADYLIADYWVWARVIENMADIGYDSNNLYLAAFDWRLAFSQLENPGGGRNDAYYSKLKAHIEIMVKSTGRKVVTICHSMGALVFYYFMKWVESPKGGAGGRDWVERHIDTTAFIGGPLLGVPKAISALFSGEMKDTADVAPMVDWMRKAVLVSQATVRRVLRSFRSVAGMLPKGGNAVWGTHDGAADDPRDSEQCPQYDYPLQVSPFSSLSANSNSSELPAKQCYSSDKAGARGSFITLNSRMNESKSSSEASVLERVPVKEELTVDEAFDWLRAEAADYMSAMDKIYSFGAADPKTLDEDDPRYWANPLQSALPLAPSMKIACLMGVGLETERGYVYQQTALREEDGNAEPRFSIDVSVSSEQTAIRKGVKLGDGDATVPQHSAGYMCTHGWRHRRYNPAGALSITREYIQKNATLPIIRHHRSVDHVDIMGNFELLADLLRLAGRFPTVPHDLPMCRAEDIASASLPFKEPGAGSLAQHTHTAGNHAENSSDPALDIDESGCVMPAKWEEDAKQANLSLVERIKSALEVARSKLQAVMQWETQQQQRDVSHSSNSAQSPRHSDSVSPAQTISESASSSTMSESAGIAATATAASSSDGSRADSTSGVDSGDYEYYLKDRFYSCQVSISQRISKNLGLPSEDFYADMLPKA